jgi:hypothetical protein
MFNTNQGKKEQGITQIETEHASVEEGLHMDERADSVQNTIEYSGNDDEEANESIYMHKISYHEMLDQKLQYSGNDDEEANKSVNMHKINYHEMLDQSLKQRTSIKKVASNGKKYRQNR